MKLKLVKREASGKTPELRLGGIAPSQDMHPGKYFAVCESAWLEQVGKGSRVVLQFRLVDGKHDGVSLRQWLPASDGGGVVFPNSRYARQCSIALNRPLVQDDPINDPASIFCGQKFVVFVGYRKTEKPRGGMATDENAQRRKDEADYLRIHEIISREDL
jgi:hypothetical protein